MGLPGKGKVKASTPFPSRGSRVEASNTSRVPPDAALSARPETSSMGSFLGAGASAAGPSTTDEGTSFVEGGPSPSQQEAPFDVDAWHEVHNPFTPLGTVVAFKKTRHGPNRLFVKAPC
jgi:hypothetical protein